MDIQTLPERVMEADSTESLHSGDILPDGTDPKLLSHDDKPEDRRRKMEFIQKHVTVKAPANEEEDSSNNETTFKKPSTKRFKDDDKTYNLRK